jgi:sodium bicarbonate transporter 10
VEEGGNRWSKPHVATLSLHSLFELRSMILNGTICLDMSAYSLEDICDLALDTMVNSNQVPILPKFTIIGLQIFVITIFPENVTKDFFGSYIHTKNYP